MARPQPPPEALIPPALAAMETLAGRWQARFAQPAAPTVDAAARGGVTIGRLEVRVSPPPTPAPPARRAPPTAPTPLARAFRTFGIAQS